MRRTSRHKDANHDAIVKLARQLGGFVIETHTVGNGAPDFFVFIRGVRPYLPSGWMAVEVKSGKGKLRAKQEAKGSQVPIAVWRSESDVYAAFGVAIPN